MSSRRDMKESAASAYAEIADLAHAWVASRTRGDDDELDVAGRIARTLAAIRDLELNASMALDRAEQTAPEVRQ